MTARLPGTVFESPGHTGIPVDRSIDCDLYSSTTTALEHVGPHLRWGTYVVFDEHHTYPGHEEHE